MSLNTHCSKNASIRYKTKHLLPFTFIYKKYWIQRHFAFNVMSTVNNCYKSVIPTWTKSNHVANLLHVIYLQLLYCNGSRHHVARAYGFESPESSNVRLMNTGVFAPTLDSPDTTPRAFMISVRVETSTFCPKRSGEF